MQRGIPIVPPAEDQLESVFVAEERARRREILAQANAESLKAVQDPDVIDSFPFIRIVSIPDGRECKFCKSQHNKLLRTKDCTADMIPPFEQCESEDGCRCTIIPMDSEEAKKAK